MGSNPINLAVRFILEVICLVVLGLFGWNLGQGLLRYLLAAGFPILAAILWGTFAVPEDPSRSGKTVVPVPGLLRLSLELSFFGVGVWVWFSLGLNILGWIFGVAVLVHYLISYDRIMWLLQQ